MRRGDLLNLTIERPVPGGRMLARQDGTVVLVAGAIPGEAVEAEVERVQRGTVWAATRRVLEASPDRRDPVSDAACGGRAFAHVSPARQVELKRDIIVDAFRRLGPIRLESRPEIVPSPEDGYRMRARLHVSGGRIGFHREGTHELCDPASTTQLRPDTVETLRRLAEACQGVCPGAVTAIDVSENVAATERSCHLELRPGVGTARLAALPLVGGVTGVSCGSPGQPRIRQLWGSAAVSDTLAVSNAPDSARATVVRNVRAFFQANRYLLAPLLQHVVLQVDRGPVWDLYAGVGLFGVAAAAAGRGSVTAVEGDAVAADDLRSNAVQCADALEVSAQAVETFLQGVGRAPRPAVVIVDPPRTGLSGAALAGLVAVGPPRVVYVSCDVATLARDAGRLQGAGYRIADVLAFDLFPSTAHVETVSVFVR